MIEDELRSLLTERAGDVGDDNAGRVGQVHERISGIRRRRTVLTTLALVLVVAGGVLFTRLPGRPETLPAGSPPGPYFSTGPGTETVPGYRGRQYFTFTGDGVWSVADQGPDTVVVARCDHRGDLTLRNVSGSGPQPRLSCRVPVGDHFEGALPLSAEESAALLAGSRSGANVAVRPSSGGSWTVGLLEPLFPASIQRSALTGAVLDGFRDPAGGRFPLTVPGDDPPAGGLVLTIGCVRDVRLEFLVSGRPLTTVTCTDSAAPVRPGLVAVVVPGRTLTALGLRPGQRVTVDVRSTGRPTAQWGVFFGG